MRRRALLSLLVPAVLAAGCSAKPRRRRQASGSRSRPSSPASSKRPKGPQGFGNMMAKEWAKDLGDSSPEKRARAARELGNMGPAAAAALPELERAAKDSNGAVSAAAKQAIAAIRRK